MGGSGIETAGTGQNGTGPEKVCSFPKKRAVAGAVPVPKSPILGKPKDQTPRTREASANPNSKPQAPKKHQGPKVRIGVRRFGIVVWIGGPESDSGNFRFFPEMVSAGECSGEEPVWPSP